jgi:hypothetical protein
LHVYALWHWSLLAIAVEALVRKATQLSIEVNDSGEFATPGKENRGVLTGRVRMIIETVESMPPRPSRPAS